MPILSLSNLDYSFIFVGTHLDYIIHIFKKGTL